MWYMQVPKYLNVSRLIVHYVPLVILLDEQLSLEPPVESHFYLLYITITLWHYCLCTHLLYCLLFSWFSLQDILSLFLLQSIYNLPSSWVYLRWLYLKYYSKVSFCTSHLLVLYLMLYLLSTNTCTLELCLVHTSMVAAITLSKIAPFTSLAFTNWVRRSIVALQREFEHL